LQHVKKDIIHTVRKPVKKFVFMIFQSNLVLNYKNNFTG
jgi:hypothetical protein